MERKRTPGTLIISLDFELMWGMFDKVTVESYGENIAGVHTVIPKLLALFRERAVHATWATVGMLMADGPRELASTLPAVPDEPQYEDRTLSAYEHLRTHDIAATPQFYFAPALVRLVSETPHQELASHTFCHYYCAEAQTVSGEKSEAFFAADCRAFAASLRRFDATATSIVFPRNQWTAAALATLAKNGFRAFRGTESHFLYRVRTDREQQNLLVRLLRLCDHYGNLSGHHTYALSPTLEHSSGLVNLPASRFLRPWNAHLRLLEPLRRARIKRSMTVAAKNGEVFHLWWHPHNFGAHQAQNLATLIDLLDHFAYLQRTYGMESLTMAEAATRVRELRA